MIRRDRLLTWLSECDGDGIWPVDYARDRGLPEAWIDQLSDALESSFDRDDQTIYWRGQAVNQFHGIRDVDLARRISDELGLPTGAYEGSSTSRRDLVRRIVEAVEEG